MKNPIRTFAAIAAFSLLAACGGDTIDATNGVTMQKSVEKIIEGLSREEAAQFQSDLQTLSFNAMKSGLGDLSKMQMIEQELMNQLDGKNPQEIHKIANEIRNRS